MRPQPWQMLVDWSRQGKEEASLATGVKNGLFWRRQQNGSHGARDASDFWALGRTFFRNHWGRWSVAVAAVAQNNCFFHSFSINTAAYLLLLNNWRGKDEKMSAMLTLLLWACLFFHGEPLKDCILLKRILFHSTLSCLQSLGSFYFGKTWGTNSTKCID